MRITAKEALDKAMTKISSESILDVIFTNISHIASTGYTKYIIYGQLSYNPGFEDPMIKELYENKATRDRVINVLEELGYDVTVFPEPSILIKWEPVENK